MISRSRHNFEEASDVTPPAADDYIAPAPRILRPDPYRVTLTWQTDSETPAGTYRIVHYGRCKKDGKVVRFVATSRPFRIGP
jgi:hypothetical protein